MSEIRERLAYTVTEAAAAAGVSRPTLYRWMNAPGFPAFRIGGTVRVPVDAFNEWLRLQTTVNPF